MATVIYHVDDGYEERGAHYATLAEAKRHAQIAASYMDQSIAVTACTVAKMPRRKLFAALASGGGWASRQEVVWQALPSRRPKQRGFA
jgi:hypothetical protein